MPVKRGSSSLADPAAAVRELRERIMCDDIEAVLLFISPTYDRAGLREAINREFAGVRVIGCTTAGEITPQGYEEGTITGAAFNADQFKINSVLLRDIAETRSVVVVEHDMDSGRLMRASQRCTRARLSPRPPGYCAEQSVRH